MATAGDTAFDEGFTHADEVLAADGELVEPESVPDPAQPLPDPTPVTSKELKEEAEDDGGNEARKLKSALMISGAVVAIIGAIFAIAKKVKEA